MSKIENQENSNTDWFEKSISEEHTKYYEYSDFKDIQGIGGGSFGSVFRATWKNTDRALKSVRTFKEVIREVKKICLHILKVSKNKK